MGIFDFTPWVGNLGFTTRRDVSARVFSEEAGCGFRGVVVLDGMISSPYLVGIKVEEWEKSHPVVELLSPTGDGETISGIVIRRVLKQSITDPKRPG